MAKALRRWKFESKLVQNLRDLGGYACHGGITYYGVLLRSDQLAGLTDEDKKMLVQSGLTTVIDLRKSEEVERFPNDFIDSENVKVHNMEDSMKVKSEATDQTKVTCMGDLYIRKLESNGSYYVSVIDLIANSPGMTIIHCLAGKDRTGIIAALILLLLGVDELDVIADYQVSQTYLKYNIEDFLKHNPDAPRYTLSSNAKNIEMLIDHLNVKYGGALQYLNSHGLKKEQHEQIRNQLVLAVNEV